MVKSGGHMVLIDIDHENGGMQLNTEFFVDFSSEPHGPTVPHEMRYPGGDCTSDIWLDEWKLFGFNIPSANIQLEWINKWNKHFWTILIHSANIPVEFNFLTEKNPLTHAPHEQLKQFIFFYVRIPVSLSLRIKIIFQFRNIFFAFTCHIWQLKTNKKKYLFLTLIAFSLLVDSTWFRMIIFGTWEFFY